VPNGDLVFDSAGNLYGATTFGGGKATTCDEFYGGNCGAIFELSPPKEKGAKWAEKVLHAFGGIDSGKQYGDGANPSGGLVLDSKGAVCGTTYIGGYNCPHNSNQGCGAVFELKPPTKRAESWTGKLIHEFKASNDVEEPNGNLIFDNAGALRGICMAQHTLPIWCPVLCFGEALLGHRGENGPGGSCTASRALRTERSPQRV
jgi:hypothetical protein